MIDNVIVILLQVFQTFITFAIHIFILSWGKNNRWPNLYLIIMEYFLMEISAMVEAVADPGFENEGD